MTRESFSAALVKHIESMKARKVSLDDMREGLSDRAFGVMLFLTALISLVPLPGAGTVLGMLPLVIGIQLVIGLPHPWLPKKVLRFQMDKKKVAQGLEILNTYLEPFERFARPRWEWMFGPIGDRLVGVSIIVAAVPIMLPMPLSNLPPALGLMVMAIGLAEKDGALIVASWVIILLSYLLLLALYGTLLFGMIFGALKVFGA